MRIPPFPGARSADFGACDPTPGPSSAPAPRELISRIRESRIGGDYWAKQPALPDGPYTLFRGPEVEQALRHTSSDGILIWADTPPTIVDRRISIVSGSCDPWHLLRGASAVVADADDDLALIAAIAGLPLTIVGNGRFSALSSGGPEALDLAVRSEIADRTYSDPFTDEPIGAADAVRLCRFWRELVDQNRSITAAFGFAIWKRPTVAPLLWGGDGLVPFMSSLHQASIKGDVAVWKSRTPAEVIRQLEGQAATIVEVEDGYIRSAGLGADCVPPLSIVVDRIGVHFDPSGPSELENLLQNGGFTPEILKRAKDLRQLIVRSGISKYGARAGPVEQRQASRRQILVPGQVEDDRAVLCGGGSVSSNYDLLRRVREREPHANIIYKPHPDVEAGHRKGAIPDLQCLTLADEVVRDQPISGLIDLVDEVHVNSSLAGFEALLRSRPVTTYGVPFYAGWGLTRDLGPVPARRTARRSLDELVAAVLLLYPRYLDPITRLPCPPEILVRRIADGQGSPRGGAIVQLRRLQGRLKKRLAGVSWR